MEIHEYLNEKKNFYDLIMCFFDNDYENNEIDFQNLTDYIENKNIRDNQNEFQEILKLISKISKNHHRDHHFFNRIEKFLSYFEEKIKQTFSNFEIFNFFKKSKRILLFLFEKEMINLDETIINFINESQNCHFFYKIIKPFIEEESQSKIEQELIQNDENIFDEFDEKCKTGENDSYICSLIREDRVEEFIVYVNQRNIQLSSKIKPSIFETNSFLLKNKPTLIEYSAFFGSIQIFQFLRMNRVNLTPSLWLYAIHGRNAELFHLLEENHVEPEDDSYQIYLEESIKCHHNDIADYIQNNLVSKKLNNNDDESHFLLLNDEDVFSTENKFGENIDAFCFHYLNFAFFPSDFSNEYIIFYLCQYNYIKLVDLLLKTEKIDLHKKIIRIFIF